MSKPKPLPPTDELRRLFYVDDKGVLRNRVDRGSRVKAGAIAGAKKDRGNRRVYMQVCVHGKLYPAHRIAYAIFYGDCPIDLQIDHKDQNGLNNAKENLHLVTNLENSRNGALYTNNTSGVTGVYWCKAGSCWRAQIKTDGRMRYLGSYNTVGEAAAARERASREHGFHENHGRERPDA